MSRYNVIGIMSGTSLDGLDIAYCSFDLQGNNWSFKINCSKTIQYPKELSEQLRKVIHFSGLELMLLHNEFGNFIGSSILSFIETNNISTDEIDCVSSHGHTVFHQPNKLLTTQIGNGANISAVTKLPVVCDFRTVDLALGGQGAPLVPIGDQLLFSAYDYRINLGGIANISFQENSTTLAYDICPVNIVLNKLSSELNAPYDDMGAFAKSGVFDKKLFNELNALDYYKKGAPKSLGIEIIEADIFPLLSAAPLSSEDKLRTFVEHIAFQIADTIKVPESDILITGGGAYNSFLIERLKELSNSDIQLPSNEIIDFKEALIFAFLGVLRFRNQVNCLSSVTGSKEDNIGGCIYQPF
jgi:anhydro-N-acetylmuramic acid kinase